MQNRQRDEISRDILTVSNGGATITQIMFKAYMSHGQAKCYLSELIENRFIEFDELNRTYRTTVNGLEYLNAMERISGMLVINTRRSAANKRFNEIYQF